MGSGKPKDELIEEKSKKAQPKKEEKKDPREAMLKRKVIEGVRGIVRVAESDCDGSKKLENALLRVRGIGFATAKAVVHISGFDPNTLLGRLTDEDVLKLENIIRNPEKFGIPVSMLNRRNDPVTGETKHLVSSELAFIKKSDIDTMKKIRCYKGIRHELGLPVRGQRTRASFRTGMVAGVSKVKAGPATVPGKPGAAPAPGAAPVVGAKPALGAKAPAAPGAKAAPTPAKKEEKK